MTSGTEWQGLVGRNWADAWRLTDRSFTGLTQRLLERLGTIPGENVVDIGCGAGELALALARTRPAARITGVDVSAHLVQVARERAGDRAKLEFACADAASWHPLHGAPDLVLSRHGVMFFDNPVLAFTHLHEVAAPRANLMFSCFRSPGENPWASGIGALLPSPPPPPAPPHYAPGPFAFADADFVRAILSRAGWAGIAFEAVDFAYVAGQGEDPIADAEAFFSRIGPFAAALRTVPEDQRDALRERLRALLDRHASGDLVVFPAAAWIVTAHNG